MTSCHKKSKEYTAQYIKRLVKKAHNHNLKKEKESHRKNYFWPLFSVLNISENTSLLPYNTFGINVSARYFIDVDSVEDLQAHINSKAHPELPTLVLGGGSNVLFTEDFDGVVLKNNISGIEECIEDDEVHLRVGAGENCINL